MRATDEPRTKSAAVERFPCPSCSEHVDSPFPILSPGYHKGMHVFGQGYRVSFCHTCQPELANRHPFVDFPMDDAWELIKQLRPVRYVDRVIKHDLHDGPGGRSQSHEMVDRLTGKAVEVGLWASQAERMCAQANREWFEGLPDIDPAVLAPTTPSTSLAEELHAPRRGEVS